MLLIYAAVAFLVVAQIIGLYGLKTRKADLVFALFMVGMLVAAIVLAGVGAYQQLS